MNINTFSLIIIGILTIQWGCHSSNGAAVSENSVIPSDTIAETAVAIKYQKLKITSFSARTLTTGILETSKKLNLQLPQSG